MLISNGWTAVDRPTPETVIEAVMWCVRERGLLALEEPDNRRHLRDCDDAARSRINARIEALIAAGRIQEPTHA